MTIRVLLNGAFGKMGKVISPALIKSDQFQLVGECGRDDDLQQSITKVKADVVIDFTNAACAYKNTVTIIEAGARPVIGSSGFRQEDVSELQQICLKHNRGGIIAPNFSIAMVLMMKMSQQAAQYYPHSEILEYHHDQKQEAPSGTALKTAEMIAKASSPAHAAQSMELIEGVRGGQCHQIPIHSIRLPGLLAHQSILFGGPGELLTLKHDCTDRNAFVPGVLLACEKVMQLSTLEYGLEQLL